MSSECFQIDRIAHLARVELTPEECSRIGGQLGQILAYVDKLKEVDVQGVEPTAHPFTLVNVTRTDEVRPSLDHGAAMKNAPKQVNGLFAVPKIVE